MQDYVNFFNNNCVLLAILWVLVIILARTKMEMHWLDFIIPLLAIALWVIFAIIV